MSTDDRSPSWHPVTPRDRGQQDKTAGGEQPQEGSHARARAAGAREDSTVAVLSTAGERARSVFERRNPAPGEGMRNWHHHGAEAGAEVLARAAEVFELAKTQPNSARKLLVALYGLYLATVGYLVTMGLAALQHALTHAVALALIAAFGLVLTVAAISSAQGVTP